MGRDDRQAAAGKAALLSQGRSMNRGVGRRDRMPQS